VWFDRGVTAAAQKGQGGLSGRLPSFAPAAKLASLRLHGNSFSGPLPEVPAGIQEVRLACNQLTGGVPSAYARLEELHTLKAEANRLSGSIEPSTNIYPAQTLSHTTTCQYPSTRSLLQDHACMQ
jgi:hypothetical protein